MKLRKKTKYEIETYFKMFELRTDSVHVLNIIKDLYRREEIKKKQNQCDWWQFDISTEPSYREKGLPYQTRAPKLEIKKLEKSGVDKALPFQVSLDRPYHPMFQQREPQQPETKGHKGMGSNHQTPIKERTEKNRIPITDSQDPTSISIQ